MSSRDHGDRSGDVDDCDAQDSRAILLRRREFLAASMVGAIGITSATSCACLSIGPPACPGPEGSKPIGKWIFIGGPRPMLVPSEPLLFAGDTFESIPPAEPNSPQTGAARIRAKWVTGSANNVLSAGAMELLDDVAPVLKTCSFVNLVLNITPDEPKPSTEPPPPQPADSKEELVDASSRALIIDQYLSKKGLSSMAGGQGSTPRDTPFVQTVCFFVCGLSLESNPGEKHGKGAQCDESLFALGDADIVRSR